VEQLCYVSRAPVRVSLVGGGTDFEEYFNTNGGKVISTTINQYIEILIKPRDDQAVLIHVLRDGFKVECDINYIYEQKIAENDLEVAIYLETISYMQLRRGIEITVTSTVAHGSGLGTSSATIVALISAIAMLENKQITKHEIAEMAYRIEHKLLNGAMGKQDMYSAAFGGLNCIEFGKEYVSVVPLTKDKRIIDLIESKCMLFDMKLYRSSSDLLFKQVQNIRSGNSLHSIGAIHELANRFHDAALVNEEFLPDIFGSILKESWFHKRKFSDQVSNFQIDEYVGACLDNGAEACKITGAGAGGHLFVYCPVDRQRNIRELMLGLGLNEVLIKFVPDGVTTWRKTIGY
jgi:D-glycero-alpha-D-manno-heptose-7-phosphate kinase